MTTINTGFYNQHGQPIQPEAFHAIHAAKLINTIGLTMALAYLKKRNVSIRLFTVARQLMAIEKACNKGEFLL